jgi:hypothetical protein
VIFITSRDRVSGFGSQIEGRKRLRRQPAPPTGGPLGVCTGPDFEKEKKRDPTEKTSFSQIKTVINYLSHSPS